MPPPSRTPPRRGAPPPARTSRTIPVTIAVIVAVLVAVWLLRPSPYGKVRNLTSAGSAIIAFGDSLTAGYGAQPGEDFPSVLAARTGLEVLNAGVSGDTTASALTRIDEVVEKNPRIVIVGLGGNDFLRGQPIADTEGNLRTIVQRLHEAGAMVILLGFEFPTLNADYGSMYERVAREEGCLFLGGVLYGILRDASLKSDAIHPNAKGYALMAERVQEPLVKLIAKADKAR